MADENNIEIQNEDTSFIQNTNKNHSTEEEEQQQQQNNQIIENGHQQQDLSTTQIDQSLENNNNTTETESSQEETTNDEQSLENNNNTNETESSQEETTNEIEQSLENNNNNNTNDTELIHEETTNNEQLLENNNNNITETESIQEEIKNIETVENSEEQNSLEESNNNIDDNSNLVSTDNDTSNNQKDFEKEIILENNPEDLKSQRERDDDEIPPSEIITNEIIINPQRKISSPIPPNNINDDRPLTELENPYENHNENHLIESPLNQTNTTSDNSFIGNEISEENPLKSATIASFLPDVVSATIEQNQDNYLSSPFQSENILNDENFNKNPADFTEEDFPPLPPTAVPVHQIINDKDFPPLPSVSNTNEEIFNKQEENLLLSTNNESIPLKSEDILGNKTLLKQTIVKGTLNSRPTRSTMVTISYTLSLVDDLTLNSRVIENITNEKYFLSENDLIPAIDICIQSMDRGERALIDSDIRHGYGENGCEDKHIPPITSLNPYRMKIDLELHDWISPPDVQKLSIDERLHWGDKKRTMGNFYYRRQDYQKSLDCYKGALRFLSIDDNPILISFDQSQKSILNDRYIQVQNNIAQVNLLLNKYEDCLKATQNVLKYDTRNVKALFRQGKALFELGKYDQAVQTLKNFQQIQKANSNTTVDTEKAAEMISICENKLATYVKNEKEIYKRMFQPPPPTTTTNNQQRQTQNNKQNNNTNANLWPYIAVGTVALAAVGLFTFIKYRKVS